MTRVETACYCLIASAFVLAGILLFSLGAQTQNTAQAELLIARDNFSLMTTITGNGDEALFVLDNASGRLYVYSLDVSRKRLDLAGTPQDLRRVFSQVPGSAGGTGGTGAGGGGR